MPVVPFPEFTGANFKSSSVNAAVSDAFNYFIENNEAQGQTFERMLASSPGTASVYSGLRGPIRGGFGQDGRSWAVGGNQVVELQGDGTFDVIGEVIADNQPCSFATNGSRGHQLLIISAGFGYIFDLISGTFGQVAAAGFPSNAIMCDYIDGYFLVLQATTSKFFVSALDNGLLWSPADVGQINSSSDNTLAFKVLSRNAWFTGSLRTEIWVDQGGTFPLAPIQPLLEFGIAAPWSMQILDGSLLLVAANQDGSAIVVRNNGYSFQKVSTTDQDRRLTALPDLWNTRAYTYQERGHSFYVVCPNNAPAEVYDLSTGLWHQRGVWNPGADRYDPINQWCHWFAFGKHLVGDRITGTIYEQSTEIGLDNGVTIRRQRTAPHVNQSNQWVFGSQVTLGVETGLGSGIYDTLPTGDYELEDGAGSYELESGTGVLELQDVNEVVEDPNLIELSFSTDGGHTYSEPDPVSLGVLGDYTRQVTWYKTPGRFYDLVLRAATTANRPTRIFSCEIRADQGTGMR